MNGTTLKGIVALAAGSLVGGFARYYLGGGIQKLLGTAFPCGTLVVNLIGCYLIGTFAAASETKWALSPEARLLLMTGFCGALTTFSALMLETDTLLKGAGSGRALFYVGMSLAFGLASLRLGAWSVRFFIH